MPFYIPVMPKILLLSSKETGIGIINIFLSVPPLILSCLANFTQTW